MSKIAGHETLNFVACNVVEELSGLTRTFLRNLVNNNVWRLKIMMLFSLDT